MQIEVRVDDNLTRMADTRTTTDRFVQFARTIQEAIEKHNEATGDRFEVYKFEMENSF